MYSKHASTRNKKLKKKYLKKYLKYLLDFLVQNDKSSSKVDLRIEYIYDHKKHKMVSEMR